MILPPVRFARAAEPTEVRIVTETCRPKLASTVELVMRKSPIAQAGEL